MGGAPFHDNVYYEGTLVKQIRVSVPNPYYYIYIIYTGMDWVYISYYNYIKQLRMYVPMYLCTSFQYFALITLQIG